MYSEKVMKCFRNPKNYGKIKNADGIGKVGNPTCLLPKEKIHKNSEVIKISNLEKNQSVLSHKGKYEKIDSIHSRKYKGNIIGIGNKLGKINLTPEHLIFSIKLPKGQKFLRNMWKRTLISSWYHAEDLKKGDIILYPISKEQKDIKFLKIEEEKPKYDFKSKEIPKRIPLNHDLLRLFGYFLSEGDIQDKPCRTYISFSLNIKEKNIINDIKKISKNLFNLNIKIKEIEKRKTARVYLYSARLARWFKSLFGNGAKYKKIPDFIMNLPAKKQKSLIYGLWKGDGYVNLNRDGPRGGYVTISYQLAQQIKILLLRQNILPSIYEEKERISKWAKHKKAYRIHVGQRESLINLCSILNIKYKPKSYASVKAWFDNNYLYIPITKIRKSKYNGKVYNLEVKNTHSFTSDALCLHNCGDIMHLYIKVKKEKGKEIIKDIKWETMGCVAAMATSSEVTELAKGKTLEEAKKITNSDVAKDLELPKFKLHCSNLAADALQAAIKDYEDKKNKKGN